MAVEELQAEDPHLSLSLTDTCGHAAAHRGMFQVVTPPTQQLQCSRISLPIKTQPKAREIQYFCLHFIPYWHKYILYEQATRLDQSESSRHSLYHARETSDLCHCHVCCSGAVSATVSNAECLSDPVDK